MGSVSRLIFSFANGKKPTWSGKHMQLRKNLRQKFTDLMKCRMIMDGSLPEDDRKKTVKRVGGWEIKTI